MLRALGSQIYNCALLCELEQLVSVTNRPQASTSRSGEQVLASGPGKRETREACISKTRARVLKMASSRKT